MGKNQTIKTIGRLIGRVVAHKILVKYTNKPESIHHMVGEIDNYHDVISDHLREFNWNNSDKERIKKEAEKSLMLSLKENHFQDVKFPKSEINKILDETIKNFLNT